MLICATYIPPESFKYYTDVIFEELDNDISHLNTTDCEILLTGDFNARTASEQDFVSNEGNSFIFGNRNFATQITYRRRNCGSSVNNNCAGKNLLEMCKANNLRILSVCVCVGGGVTGSWKREFGGKNCKEEGIETKNVERRGN